MITFTRSAKSDGKSLIDLDFVVSSRRIPVYYPPHNGLSDHKTNTRINSATWMAQCDYTQREKPNELLQVYGVPDLPMYSPDVFVFEYVSENYGWDCLYRVIPIDVAEIYVCMMFEQTNPDFTYTYHTSNSHCILCDISKEYGTVTHSFDMASYHIDCFKQFQKYLQYMIQEYVSDWF